MNTNQLNSVLLNEDPLTRPDLFPRTGARNWAILRADGGGRRPATLSAAAQRVLNPILATIDARHPTHVVADVSPPPVRLPGERREFYQIVIMCGETEVPLPAIGISRNGSTFDEDVDTVHRALSAIADMAGHGIEIKLRWHIPAEDPMGYTRHMVNAWRSPVAGDGTEHVVRQTGVTDALAWARKRQAASSESAVPALPAEPHPAVAREDALVEALEEAGGRQFGQLPRPEDSVAAAAGWAYTTDHSRFPTHGWIKEIHWRVLKRIDPDLVPDDSEDAPPLKRRLVLVLVQARPGYASQYRFSIPSLDRKYVGPVITDQPDKDPFPVGRHRHATEVFVEDVLRALQVDGVRVKGALEDFTDEERMEEGIPVQGESLTFNPFVIKPHAVPKDPQDEIHRLRTLLASAGFCADCLEETNHDVDEPFSSCSCGNGEDTTGPSVVQLLRMEIEALQNPSQAAAIRQRIWHFSDKLHDRSKKGGLKVGDIPRASPRDTRDVVFQDVMAKIGERGDAEQPDVDAAEALSKLVGRIRASTRADERSRTPEGYRSLVSLMAHAACMAAKWSRRVAESLPDPHLKEKEDLEEEHEDLPGQPSNYAAVPDAGGIPDLTGDLHCDTVHPVGRMPFEWDDVSLDLALGDRAGVHSDVAMAARINLVRKARHLVNCLATLDEERGKARGLDLPGVDRLLTGIRASVNARARELEVWIAEIQT